MSSADHLTTKPAAGGDIFFVPAPDRVVAEMLKIARLNSGDVVMDLGSGDGQILIAAALQHGSRGIGIELDPQLVSAARNRALLAGVADRMEFFVEDFFSTDLRPATVLTLYLLESINIRLRPKILAQCLPGTRVVTYSFEMGEWQCDAHTPVAANGVSLWIVPANLTGTWRVSGDSPEKGLESLLLTQHFQELAGSAEVAGETCGILAGRIRAHEFTVSLQTPEGTRVVSGQVQDDHLEATVTSVGRKETIWRAEREPGTRRPLEAAPGQAV